MKLLVVLVTFVPHLIYAATIGDGRTSLITGRALNISDTRGSCLVDGQLYLSGTSIPRTHPCHYCLCVVGRVECYWKRCPTPPLGCEIFQYPGVCEPSLYVCSIPDVLSPPQRLPVPDNRLKRLRPRSVSNGIRLDIDDLPFNFDQDFVKKISHRLHRRSIDNRDKGCSILGVDYRVGEVIGVASDMCMECRCAAQSLFCSPRCCFTPATLLLDTRTLYRRIDEEPVAEQQANHPLQHLLDQL